MEKNNNKIVVIICSIIAVIVGAAGMYLVFHFLPSKTVTNINKSEKEVTVNDKGISDAVEKVYDSVVVVETYKSKQQVSSGTGFVYKKDNDKAYILTNNHVVDGGDEVYVVFTNNKQVSTKIVGKDEYADIAVLEVNSNEVISVAELGSSENTKLGDTVFAVGAPLDNAYSWTVTRGILSGKDRMVEVSLSNSSSSDWIMKVIQTDAAINSGNSGGPLANSNGEVIGITSMKLVSSGVEGMGFAIPIEDALDYANKIVSGAKTIRPLLGVSMIDSNDLYSLYSNGVSVSSKTKGVVVASVQTDSAADKAGLQKGDIITKLGDNDITSIAELRYYLYKYNVGDTVELKYVRNDKENIVKVKLTASES